jgi:hypothetical protein
MNQSIKKKKEQISIWNKKKQKKKTAHTETKKKSLLKAHTETKKFFIKNKKKNFFCRVSHL